MSGQPGPVRRQRFDEFGFGAEVTGLQQIAQRTMVLYIIILASPALPIPGLSEAPYRWSPFLEYSEQIVPENIVSGLSDAGDEEGRGQVVFFEEGERMGIVVGKSVVEGEADVEAIGAKAGQEEVFEGNNVEVVMIDAKVFFEGLFFEEEGIEAGVLFSANAVV